ncbi:MAG: EamA/RhaT family transporter [Sedimentibacter sp.]|nr:EamA/RhaT family transporter [Sedimentibacter sp.]
MMMVENKPVTLNLSGTISMLYLGLVTTMLCFLMQTVGQKYTSTTHAAIILSLEAVIGSVFGVIFLGEKYSIMTIIAFMFIFLAIITAETGFEWMLKRFSRIE